MNFLAHIYLSEDQEKVIVGNFIGDFVKGKAFERYDGEIRRGILLHREIDRYTDDHQVVSSSKKRLRPKYHHYAPVIVDIFYDHFLAKLWDHYHQEELINYSLKCYNLLDDYIKVIPLPAAQMLKYMRQDNWLYNYRHIEGIGRALNGMARRTSFNSRMELATADLQKDYDAFQEEFVVFFPDLKQHASAYLKSLT